MPDHDRQNQPAPEAGIDRKEHPSHIADEPVTDADSPDATIKPATTDTGLPVEEQIHKEWDPNKDGGLPTPLTSGAAESGDR